MMFDKSIKEIISVAREEALELGYTRLNSNVLLLALQPTNSEFFLNAKLDMILFKENIRSGARKDLENLIITEEAENVLIYSMTEAFLHKERMVQPIHLVLAMLRYKNCLANKYLTMCNVSYDELQEEIFEAGIFKKSNFRVKFSKLLFNPILKYLNHPRWFIFTEKYLKI